jgi:hypothetical protein
MVWNIAPAVPFVHTSSAEGKAKLWASSTRGSPAALRLDPSYARALGLHSWLSIWNAHAGSSAGRLAAVLAPATEQARAKVAIDRDDPWARLALGFSHMLRREH